MIPTDLYSDNLKNWDQDLANASGFNSSRFFKMIPVEGLSFLIASVATRIFSISFGIFLAGIGISLIATTLVIKSIDCYDHRVLISLTKEACKFNKNYPKLRLITFISGFILSSFSKKLAFATGVFLGSYGGLILDVETYKQMQQANRKQRG